jgi:hypothetical protein
MHNLYLKGPFSHIGTILDAWILDLRSLTHICSKGGGGGCHALGQYRPVHLQGNTIDP